MNLSNEKVDEWKQSVIKTLKSENSYVPSGIEGVTDLIWSIGVRVISPDKEVVIKWFNSKIPAFGSRIPMDILKEDGEDILFGLMMTIPC